MKPACGLTGINMNGTIHTDPSTVHTALSEYWAAGFSPKNIDDNAMDVLLSYCKIFPEANFLISFDEFLEVIRGRKDTAPGPDSTL